MYQNSLIKLQKIYKRIRPLINAKAAPNYKIFKLLSQILKHKVNIQYKHNIKKPYRIHGAKKK